MGRVSKTLQVRATPDLRSIYDVGQSSCAKECCRSPLFSLGCVENDRYSFIVSINMALRPGQLLLASRGFFSQPGPSAMFGRGSLYKEGLVTWHGLLFAATAAAQSRGSDRRHAARLFGLVGPATGAPGRSERRSKSRTDKSPLKQLRTFF